MIHFFKKTKTARVRVAALIYDEHDKVLLVQQRKGKTEYWLLPGGGIEFGESAVFALERELKEELQLQLVSAQFAHVNESIDPKKKRHLVQLVFLVQVALLRPMPNPKESSITGFGFFSVEEILAMDLRPDTKSYFQSPSSNKPSYISSPWVNEP